MKRLFCSLTLLTLCWLPYAMHRWLTLPYIKAFWDSYLLYASALVVAILSLANVLLL